MMLELFLITAVIDADERRDFAVTEITGAFIQTEME